MGTYLTRFSRWRRLRRVQNAATIGLVVLGPLLAALTYTVLGPLDRGGGTPALRLVLLADLVYVLIVAALVLQRVAQLVMARRAKSAGSQLHLRLTAVFGLLALIPTVLVAVFAVLSINVGLEGWFSERVQNVLGSSLSAAQAYEEEHRQELTRDGTALAAYLNQERQKNFFMSPGQLRQILGQIQPAIETEAGTNLVGDQAALVTSKGRLTEAFVIDGSGEIVARGARSYEFNFEPVTREQIDQSVRDGLLIIEDYTNNEFRAIIPLESMADSYLYVSRAVDGHILALLDNTKETVGLYQQLEKDRGRLLFEFGLLYLGFAIILILASIWLGLWFAERLSRPVGRLVTASQRVGEGDLDVRVIEDDGDDEISQLGHYFNQMTGQLKEQRQRLLENTDQIEQRRRLFDSVLSSITSGVIGLDPDGSMTFVNRSGRRLLDVAHPQHAVPLALAVPEFTSLFAELQASGLEVAQGQVNLIRNGTQETLLVRVSTRRTEEGAPEGYVVAFDDVTDLVSAQRTAAWGDVARRIAHEIKNPLTPIQLSAERIKRKFSPKVGADAEQLEQMTDVIVRQTNDLRRIVDEFSKFARMPEANKNTHDIVALVRDAVTLQEAGQPGVRITTTLPDHPVLADLDQTMVSQALTNLIKNAGEAIETLYENGKPKDHVPEIRVALDLRGQIGRITIADNGIGLPEDRARLFEPYVTTRAKGTGLGLPIVKKIIEEHGGTLHLQDAPLFEGNTHFGAMAVIDLPLLAPAPAQINKIPA